MPEWLLPVLVVLAAALAGGLIMAALRPGGSGSENIGILAGRLEAFAASQERLATTTVDRLDAMAQRLDGAVASQNERLGRTLADTAERTHESARRIHERLAVIDEARKNLEALGGQVTNLAGILGNKQARGAFGEVQLHDLVADRLPADGFAWQHTLANGTRCDCLIKLPFPPGPIAVDSKFPLEAWQAWRAATGEATRTLALRRLGADIRKHVDDVASKYICPGETAEGALIFLPSEALFAELHAHHAALVQQAARRGVYLVSPGTLWAVLGTMRALMRDVRLRAEAQHLRGEISRLAEETDRLDKRVGALKRHFADMQGDVQQIELTSQKIAAAGARIEAMELDHPAPARAAE